jgi:hypothetical protein
VVWIVGLSTGLTVLSQARPKANEKNMVFAPVLARESKPGGLARGPKEYYAVGELGGEGVSVSVGSWVATASLAGSSGWGKIGFPPAIVRSSNNVCLIQSNNRTATLLTTEWISHSFRVLSAAARVSS